jgi:hypothetical protein
LKIFWGAAIETEIGEKGYLEFNPFFNGEPKTSFQMGFYWIEPPDSNNHSCNLILDSLQGSKRLLLETHTYDIAIV